MLINCILECPYIGTTDINNPYMTFKSCVFSRYSYRFHPSMVDNNNILLNMLMFDKPLSKNYTFIHNMFKVYIGKKVFFYKKEQK